MAMTMTMQNVVLLEFNELTPSLMDRFIAEGRLPNFERFRRESRVFITDAAEREPNLEPWIQWVTVHSGQTYAQHGVFHLDEGHKLTAPMLWDVLAERGHASWICGSMNPARKDGRTAVLPDPWCTKVAPWPQALDTFFQFVRQQVLEHTNDRVPLGVRDYARFLTFMATHGLSFRSIRATISQLLAERRDPDCKWKRVVLLDRLQLDVFKHFQRRLTPAFSTLFLNSTAHYQHAYWDRMEPEQFGADPNGARDDSRSEAILFGYQQMDTLLGELIESCGSNTTLILSTALSQEPWIDHQSQSGGAFYRPKDIAEFARAVNVAGRYTVAPVMTEQFHLEFQQEAAAVEAERHLADLRIDGEPLMFVERQGHRVFAGCALRREVHADADISLGDKSVPFFELFYKVPTAKTGMHHPDGLLWFRMADRQHADGGRVPLTSVAPTILSLFDIAAPATMESAPISLAPAARAQSLRAIA
jgi:hypothetical protein